MYFQKITRRRIHYPCHCLLHLGRTLAHQNNYRSSNCYSSLRHYRFRWCSLSDFWKLVFVLPSCLWIVRGCLESLSSSHYSTCWSPLVFPHLHLSRHSLSESSCSHWGTEWWILYLRVPLLSWLLAGFLWWDWWKWSWDFEFHFWVWFCKLSWVAHSWAGRSWWLGWWIWWNTNTPRRAICYEILRRKSADKICTQNQVSPWSHQQWRRCYFFQGIIYVSITVFRKGLGGSEDW